MQLSDFHTLVRNTCKRGTSLDGDIPGAVRQAALATERRFTFSHMRGYYTETLAAGQSSITNWTGLTASKIKAVLNCRIVDGSTTDIVWVKREEERLFPSQLTQQPRRFWQSKKNEVFFDSIADQAYTMRFKIAVYTTWPTTLSEEPALLDEAEDLVLYRTMMNLAPVMRDQSIFAIYKNLWDLEIAPLVEAQVDRDELDTDHRMQYGVSY